MILKISVISVILFILFISLYILCIFKKSYGALFRVSGFIALITLIIAIIFSVIYIKSNNIKVFNRLKSYDIKEKYAAVLASKGAEEAYPLLPSEIYAQNEQFFVVNAKKDAFAISEGETEYSLTTSENKILYLGANKTLKAKINSENELILDGYLFYSQFDGKTIEYKNKVIAKNVKSCNFTANSLFYITTDGDLYGLGFNEYGQLGDSTTKNKAKPVLIKNGILSASVSDSHSLIVDKFGTLYAVGDNSYSQLGNKTAVSSSSLTKIMQGVKDVRAGNYYSLVLTVNGELYTAGRNDFGQLGNDGKEFKAELIHTLNGVEKIEMYGNTCAALTYSGTLYVWGDNTDFKAGNDKEGNILSPMKLYDNVYDFALGSEGIAIITKDRDILISKNGKLDTCAVFGAQIPEGLQDRFSSKYNISDKKV